MTCKINAGRLPVSRSGNVRTRLSRGAPAACALVALVLGQPARADDLSDLRGQMQKLQAQINELQARQESAQAAAAATATKAATDSLKGSFPRSFKLPGTDTSIRIGGYAKLDAIYDFGPGAGDFVGAGSIPLNGTAAGNRRHIAHLNARESRLNVTTETPSDLGTIRSVIEADFYGSGGTQINSNSAGLRLRHAYVTAGPFLFGQTDSNLTDVRAIAETLDFGGPAGRPFLRQPQARYTLNSGNHLLALSVENPDSDYVGNTAANTSTPTAVGGLPQVNLSHVPDVVGRYAYTFPWGHLSAQGVLRRISVDDGRTRDSVLGYQLGASGSVQFLAKDRAFFHVLYGDGGQRYFAESPGQSANYNGSRLETQKAYGGYAGVQHWWSDTLRSTAVYGYQRIRNDLAVVPATVNKTMQTVNVNFIATLAPSFDVGIEYIYGMRALENGTRGRVDRLQTSAIYRF